MGGSSPGVAGWTCRAGQVGHAGLSGRVMQGVAGWLCRAEQVGHAGRGRVVMQG
jgi:hypothetical protein